MLRLHNSQSQAHIEDLKDRVCLQLAQAPADPYDRSWIHTVAQACSKAVQDMDRGFISVEKARKACAAFRIPNFSFETWLVQMVEEGVYVEDEGNLQPEFRVAA